MLMQSDAVHFQDKQYVHVVGLAFLAHDHAFNGMRSEETDQAALQLQ